MIPTIKLCDLGGYEKITTCKSCSYGDSKYLHHQLQLQRVYLHSISMEKGASFRLPQKTLHTSTLMLTLLQMRILILTPEGLRPVPHQCFWPERCSSLFCVFDRINWSVRSSVVKNPHHTYATLVQIGIRYDLYMYANMIFLENLKYKYIIMDIAKVKFYVCLHCWDWQQCRRRKEEDSQINQKHKKLREKLKSEKPQSHTQIHYLSEKLLKYT